MFSVILSYQPFDILFQVNRRLFVISLILFVNVTGYGLILPLLPFFADNLGAGPLVVGLFISTFHLFAMIAGPFLGEFSDRFGRKPILLVSTAGTVIGFLLLGVAQTLPILFLARIIDGISAGNSSTARAVIADITPKESRVSRLGFTFAAESLGLITGPLIGGTFAQYGFTVSAYIAAAIAALAFLLTLLVLPETRDFSQGRTGTKKKVGLDLSGIFKALQAAGIRNYIFVVFIVQFLIMVMWGTLALYGKAIFGFTGKEMGYISAFAATVGIFSQTVLLNALLRFLKEKAILVFGLSSMGLGMTLLGMSNSVSSLLSGVGLMAMSFNILMPTVTGLASEMSSDDKQGQLMGTISSTTFLGALTGPVVGNAIFSLSMRGNYFFGGMVAMVAALVSVRGIMMRAKTTLHDLK
jgi:DHA1 family tetracycline resistance protein-like MFS transporter